MKQSLQNDEFEIYLRQQVKNHRMYATDGIWRNIQNTIHTQTSWPALSFISIFLIAVITAGTLLTKPNTHLLPSQYHPASQASIAVSENDIKTSTETLRQHISADNITKETIKDAAETLQLQSTNAIAQYNLLNDDDVVLMNRNDVDEKIFNKSNIDLKENIIDLKSADNSKPTTIDKKVNSTYLPTSLSAFMFMKPIVSKKQNWFFMNSFNSTPQIYFKNSKTFLSNWLTFPTYVSDDATRHSSKWSYEVYATPSASYRRLYDVVSRHSPQTFITAIPAVSNNVIDGSQSIHYKPALGIEAGVAFGYKLSAQLTLKTGLQFNMRQYNIETSAYNAQSNPNASENFSVDTLNNSSSQNNYDYVLNDRYYEISLPIGINWKAISLKKITMGIEASVQPTYTFDKQPFIITSDFKSYEDGASLMRKWNINTAFETYFAYKTGSFTWQAGPQFRYQQLPAFSNQYPIREHLLDYGLKIGVTKSIK